MAYTEWMDLPICLFANDNQPEMYSTFQLPKSTLLQWRSYLCVITRPRPQQDVLLNLMFGWPQLRAYLTRSFNLLPHMFMENAKTKKNFFFPFRLPFNYKCVSVYWDKFVCSTHFCFYSVYIGFSCKNC